jgi:hypothetical protein
MKAVVRTRYGSPDVLELRDVEMPAISDDKVLVRVRASSLNMGDVDYMRGRPFVARLGTGLRRPKNPILGLDVAGQVESAGKAVTRFAPGDEVFTDMTDHGFGAFAEYVSVPEGALAHKPATLTFEEAATVPQSAILALQGFGGGRPIKPGQKVLVNGASGNVGPFAIQIAKAAGAEVTGICRTAKMDWCAPSALYIDYNRGFTRATTPPHLDVAGTTRCSAGGSRRGTMSGSAAPRGRCSRPRGPWSRPPAQMGITWWWKPFRLEVWRSGRAHRSRRLARSSTGAIR